MKLMLQSKADTFLFMDVFIDQSAAITCFSHATEKLTTLRKKERQSYRSARLYVFTCAWVHDIRNVTNQ